MHTSSYLDKNYRYKSTTHAKLLHDFTGKTIEELKDEGVFYVGLGFSYQEHYKLPTLNRLFEYRENKT